MATVKAFRCSHSGKYFPADYAKNWGRLYGIGLGPQPVSECLDSDYAHSVAMKGTDVEGAMHPVGVTHAQVDFCVVDEDEYNNNKMILAKDDPDYTERVKIMKENQEKKSPALRSLREELRKQKKEGVI